MSASFYDLLKYAATGIASPDMTYYDRMRASTLMGGVVQSLTGQPPLMFKADGTPLISWSMKGNGSQTGTPTPDNPVMPTFCGVRTANLFDYGNETDTIDNSYINKSGSIISSNSYYISYPIYVAENASYVWRFNSDVGNGHSAPTIGFYDSSDNLISAAPHANGVKYFSFTTPNDCKYIRASVYKGYKNEAMLNTGTEPLPYEPYGWAEKITCAGQTTPVYLGQVSTVRRVKKLVLDGTESYTETTGWKNDTTSVYYVSGVSGILNLYTELATMSTHFSGATRAVLSNVDNAGICSPVANGVAFRVLTADMPTVSDFKTWLAAQYAAGTPVTVWYVLATEQTAIVNEPLAKIGDYADELSSTDAGVTIPTVKGSNTLTVDTELQPSEMTITYRG